MIALELLNRQRLFQDLPLEVLQDVQPAVRLQEFGRRDFVLHKGVAGDALLMLVSGRLQVISTSESGKEVGISFIEPGDYFGEISLIDGGPRSASIVAMTQSVVGFLPKVKALWLFQNVPAIAARIQARLCTVIRNEIQFRSSMGSSKAYARIYSVICSNPQLEKPPAQGPTPLDDMPNQNAIASMANVSRETVSRALGALVRAGVIRKDGRKLWVQDPMVLKRLASGEIGLDNIPNPPNPGARQVPGQQAGRRLVVQLQPRVIRRSQPSNPD
jgi:CRP/FNR family transcriptional regulator, cyclic AMP receptor protein